MWSHNRSHSEHVNCHISKYQAWCEPSTPRAQTERSFLAFPEHLVIQGSHKKRMSYDVMIDPKDPTKSNLREEAWDLAESPSPSLSFASTSGHPRPAPLRGTKLSIYLISLLLYWPGSWLIMHWKLRSNWNIILFSREEDLVGSVR